MKILIIEDEIRMANAIAEILKQEHYEVNVCYDGNSGLEMILCELHDLIILDVMLPGLDGFSVLKQARSSKITIPILMLTAKSEVSDKVCGLDGGANDYLTKPFAVPELLARIRVLTRTSLTDQVNTISVGDLTLHTDSIILFCKTSGDEIRLSEKEYKLMEALMIGYGKVLTRENLVLRVWGYDSEAEYNNVEVYISFTRKKLQFLGTHMKIKAVRGIGYELKGDDYV